MTELLEQEDLQEDLTTFAKDIELSQNHAIVQPRLVGWLIQDDRFTVATELGIDVSTPDRQQMLKKCRFRAERELKPDVCLYSVNDLNYLDPAEQEYDVARTPKVPLLCIEIVSPSQGSNEILRKFCAYFAMGVKSCWYVDPNLKVIKIYSSPKDSDIFSETAEVIDKVLNIHLPLDKIFFKGVFKFR
jgi:Uma2 family endonuclease